MIVNTADLEDLQLDESAAFSTADCDVLDHRLELDCSASLSPSGGGGLKRTRLSRAQIGKQTPPPPKKMLQIPKWRRNKKHNGFAPMSLSFSVWSRKSDFYWGGRQKIEFEGRLSQQAYVGAMTKVALVCPLGKRERVQRPNG